MNILKAIDGPVIGLSPMDGVTDAPYRFIQKKYGNPDVIFTEFTNVEGLSRGAERLFLDQLYNNIERPVIGQIYGSRPETFYHAAKIIVALGFDGIDINMGCPAKNVESSGAGAALIKTPELAKEIVRATRKGVQDYLTDRKLTGVVEGVEGMVTEANCKRMEKTEEFPGMSNALDSGGNPDGLGDGGETQGEREDNFTISVKTRIGYSENIVEDWMKHLTEVEPDWISVHGRTLKQMYGGFANYNALASAVHATHIPILANGDISSSNKAVEVLKHTNARGVLIGRATYGNPWIFHRKPKVKDLEDDIQDYQPTVAEVKKVMIEHAHLHWQLKGPQAFNQMRKNLAWYVKGWQNAAELRAKLVQTSSPRDVGTLLNEYIPTE